MIEEQTFIPKELWCPMKEALKGTLPIFIVFLFIMLIGIFSFHHINKSKKKMWRMTEEMMQETIKPIQE